MVLLIYGSLIEPTIGKAFMSVIILLKLEHHINQGDIMKPYLSKITVNCFILFLILILISTSISINEESLELLDPKTEKNDVYIIDKYLSRSGIRSLNTKWTLNNSLISGIETQWGHTWTSPAFADLDYDADFDAIVAYEDKTDTIRLKYFKNTGTKIAANFEFQGTLKDDQGHEINFSRPCSIVLKDLNGDNDFDLIIGNYGSGPPTNLGYIHYYENVGSVELPIWKDQGKFVDNASQVINTKWLQCNPTLGDLDDDEDLDLIIGSLSSSDPPMLAYRNTGTKYIPEWTLDSSLIENIEIPGNRLTPTLADLDYDGDLDLIMGAKKEEDGVWMGRLYFYNNTGTKTAPNWQYDGTLTDQNSEDIQMGGANNQISTDFVDIDGDLDLDLVFGCAEVLGCYEDPALKLFDLKNFELVDGDSTHKNLCYAKYRSYTFILNTTNYFGALDFEYIKLHFNPFDDDLQIVWCEDNRSFYEIHDPKNYVLIGTPCDDHISNDNDLDLTFKIIFNWNYPNESLEDCQISLKTKSYPKLKIYNFKDIYQVENDLEFAGELSVNAEFSGNLTNKEIGDKWVRSRENLTWSGLKVVYQDSGFYPPDEEFDVTVWDESGNHWSDIDSAGRSCIINGKALNYSKEEANYTVNITGIPASSGMANTNFQLNVDADDIIFYNPYPSSKDWRNKDEVKCKITLEDYRVIDKGSIMYRTSIDGLEGYGDWQSTNVKNDNKIIIVSVDEIFEEGIDNYIQWKAADIDGEKYSSDYIIKIDTTPVYYDTPKIEKSESDQTYVKLKTTISDALSGVNISSIKYWFSKTGSTFTENYRTNFDSEIINENTIECTAQLVLGAEDNNYIKWEAEDKAGNIRDMIFKISFNITESEINVSLISPGNNNIVTTLTPKFYWSGKSGLTYNLYLSSNKDDVEQQKFEALIETAPINNPWFKIPNENALTNNQRYYWTVIPINNGIKGFCVNGIWEFFIDTSDSSPIVTYVLPVNNSDVDTLSPVFEWKMDYSGLGDIFYSFYIGSNPNSLAKEKEGYSETTLELDYPLTNFKRYYWRVFSLAKLSNGEIIEGTSISGVWNFYVDSSEIREFGVNLEIGITSIKMFLGDKETYEVKITNTGNVPDIFKVTINRGHLDEKIISLEKTDIPFWLRPNEDIILNLSIKIDPDYSTGDYQVTILVKSINNGSVFDSETVNIEIKGSEESNWFESWGYLLLVIVIIIVILIIGFIFINKKKKKKEASSKLQPTISTAPPIQIVKAELIQGPPHLTKQVSPPSQIAPQPSSSIPLTSPQAQQQLPTIQPPAALPPAQNVTSQQLQQQYTIPSVPQSQSSSPQQISSEKKVGITPSDIRKKKY